VFVLRLSVFGSTAHANASLVLAFVQECVSSDALPRNLDEQERGPKLHLGTIRLATISVKLHP
jgi:hypothetical protein